MNNLLVNLHPRHGEIGLSQQWALINTTPLPPTNVVVVIVEMIYRHQTWKAANQLSITMTIQPGNIHRRSLCFCLSHIKQSSEQIGMLSLDSEQTESASFDTGIVVVGRTNLILCANKFSYSIRDQTPRCSDLSQSYFPLCWLHVLPMLQDVWYALHRRNSRSWYWAMLFFRPWSVSYGMLEWKESICFRWMKD